MTSRGCSSNSTKSYQLYVPRGHGGYSRNTECGFESSILPSSAYTRQISQQSCQCYVYSFHSSLIFSDKNHHSMLRRLLSPSFRSTSLNEFESSLKRYSQDLMEVIRRNSANGGIVDLNEWFNRLSFDVFLCIILTFRFLAGFLLAVISELLTTRNSPHTLPRFTTCLNSLVSYAKVTAKLRQVYVYSVDGRVSGKIPTSKDLERITIQNIPGSRAFSNLMWSFHKSPFNKI